MKLVNCELDLPLYSNGLRHLREITFQDMRAKPVMIQSIFSNCLSLTAMKLVKCTSVLSFGAMSNALQTLVIKDCHDVHSIGIISPALRTFHYHGKITEFNAYCDLPHLSDVILDIAHPRNFQLLLHRKEVMNSLSHVRTLTVTSTFLEGLGARYNGNEYKDVEFFLWKLQEFHLIVAPESFLNPSDILIFLKKCRYVERVFFDLRKNALGNSFYWNNYGKKYLEETQIVFPFLKYVRITGFTMRELPVSMARYFLKNAVRLRCLMIVKARIHQFPEFYNLECLRLGIISNATIEIYEHNRDRSAIMPEHSGHL